MDMLTGHGHYADLMILTFPYPQPLYYWWTALEGWSLEVHHQLQSFPDQRMEKQLTSVQQDRWNIIGEWFNAVDMLAVDKPLRTCLLERRMEAFYQVSLYLQWCKERMGRMQRFSI